MEVGLLGPLRITEHGEDVPLKGAKIRALVGILAVHRSEPVGAERLIDLLWGDEPPTNPANALQAQISVLRRTLGAERVRTVGAAYALALDPSAYDVARFEELAAAGRAAAERGDNAAAAQQLRDALALWRGDALAEFTYEDWARTEITRLEELRAAAMDARIDAELALGRDADLIADIEASLAADRLHEHRWAQLMIALYRSGRQGDALRAYADARTTLVDELGVDPGPELVELEAKILRHDPALTPMATDRAPLRGRLPTPLTTFFGRARELELLADALGDEARRLITLIGPGGAGKTRVAIAAAREATERDDALLAGFATLETVTDADAIAPAVAAALGLRREGLPTATPGDVLDAIAVALADRRAVLVLDNCEHVITDAARVAEALLLRCPTLTILATSREALTVTGEHLIAIGPLDPADATALFTDRATAARPSIGIADTDAVVGAICERLDGMPLAVELAAARARVLPVPQIAERLADRFRLLTGGSRTAVPRQQTLRAVVDWSYELLFEHERTLFARLAVFSGGWTLDAAEVVCSDESMPADDVLDILASLVEKSLVVAEPTGRYRMLQTLAEYARERLAESAPASAVVRDRHAHWYAELAEGADEGLTSVDATTWRTRLEAELDNLRAAFDWLCESGSENGPRLASEIALLWWLRGDFAEGARWAERAASIAADTLRAVNEAWSAFYRANSRGETDDEVADAAAAVGALESSGDIRSLTKARVILAAIRSRRRDPLLERDALAAIETAAVHGDPWYEGVGHALLAMSSVRGGDLTRAAAAAERSVELLGLVNDRALIFEAWSVLVTIALLSGRPDDAESLAREQVESARAAHLPQYEEWGLARVGYALAAKGDTVAALEAFDAALALGAERWADAFAHLGRAICRRREHDLDGARADVDHALLLQQRIGALTEQAHLHLLAAWLDVDAADADAARAAATRAVDLLPDNPSIRAMADEVRAAAAVVCGDPAPALEPSPPTGHVVWIFTRADVDRLLT